jgi:hypothetical protein
MNLESLARDMFFINADEKTLMEFYQHLGVLLPRKPFLDELQKEYRHRQDRCEGQGLASCEYAVVTYLVHKRVRTQMRGYNVIYYRWLQCSMCQTMSQVRVTLSCDDLINILDTFRRSKRLIVVLNIPNAVFTMCCLKASGVYSQFRRKILLCFLDCPNSFMFHGEKDNNDMRYETSEDILVTPTLALSRDTNRALGHLSSSHDFQIVSEWEVNDFFRVYQSTTVFKD